MLADHRGEKGQLRADQASGQPRVDLIQAHYQQLAAQGRPAATPPERPAQDKPLPPWMQQMQKELAVNTRGMERANEKAMHPRDVKAFVQEGIQQIGTRQGFAAAARETSRAETTRAEQTRREADRQWLDQRPAASAGPRSEVTDAMLRHTARELERQQRPRERSGIERYDRGDAWTGERTRSRDGRER